MRFIHNEVVLTVNTCASLSVNSAKGKDLNNPILNGRRIVTNITNRRA